MPGMHTEMQPVMGQIVHPSMMMSTTPIGIPMTREGSGTSWMPDSTPIYGLMRSSGKWGMMFQGAAHLAYDNMNGPRGDQKLIMPNWGMAMGYTNPTPSDQLRLALMLSLDPLTVGGAGYPILFQTGETWQGQPLKDHQHPHNFWSEISANYTHAFGPNSAGYVYLAPAGEPALGPPTYMHRTYALDNFVAPLGHHWQDSTHLSFWVATLGWHTRTWQVESSVFNGREPGENRYTIDSPLFNSFSGRISWNPSRNLAAQVSYGFRKSPEVLHPEEDDHRVTASLIYNDQLDSRRNFQATLVWGQDITDGQRLNSFLLEAELKHDGSWTPFARYEYVQKNAEELVLPSQYPASQVFGLQQATLGVVHDFATRGSFYWGIGAQVLFNFVPGDLKSVYGDNPAGWIVFVRVHPKRMQN